MANKREFKNYVKSVGDGLLTDMMAIYVNLSSDANVEAIDNVLITLIEATQAALVKSNVKFDKTTKAFESRKQYSKERKAFYRALYKGINNDFVATVNESLKEFNAAVKAIEK